MDLGSLFLALALSLLVAAFVARPILEQVAHPNGSSAASPADDLIAERESVIIELRELDFDHTTGKIGAEDYAAQRTRLITKGAQILRQLDQLPSTPPVTDRLDDEIEKLVAARRKKSRPGLADRGGALTCANCQQPFQPGDKFCPRCGTKLLAVELAK